MYLNLSFNLTLTLRAVYTLLPEKYLFMHFSSPFLQVYPYSRPFAKIHSRDVVLWCLVLSFLPEVARSRDLLSVSPLHPSDNSPGMLGFPVGCRRAWRTAFEGHNAVSTVLGWSNPHPPRAPCIATTCMASRSVEQRNLPCSPSLSLLHFYSVGIADMPVIQIAGRIFDNLAESRHFYSKF